MWRCIYCDCLNPEGEYECKNCGAPRRRRGDYEDPINSSLIMGSQAFAWYPNPWVTHEAHY